MHPKIMENRCVGVWFWGHFGSILKSFWELFWELDLKPISDNFLTPFWTDFGADLEPRWAPNPLKINDPSGVERSMPRVTYFGRVLGGIWEPKWTKNRRQTTTKTSFKLSYSLIFSFRMAWRWHQDGAKTLQSSQRCSARCQNMTQKTNKNKWP